MEEGIRMHKIVKDSRGEVFTGFLLYANLAGSNCKFVPMNSNRAINAEVVNQRVEENVRNLESTGRYLDFGQINLIIIADDDSYDFLVMDGQHRCETMRILFERDRGTPIDFQFRAKVVQTERDAFAELDHFQRAYPTDPRSFFRSRAEARAATAILARLKARHPPRLFGAMTTADRHGRGTRDPQRPFLNDNLLFWLLQEAGLARGAGAERAGAANAQAAEALLDRASRFLATLPKEDLGRGATEKMRKTAGELGCWLGFFRDADGMLRWGDVAPLLEAPEALAAPEAVPGAAARPEGSGSAAGLCCICLENPAAEAFSPCGHRCVCPRCAADVLAARPPVCPLCRGSVTGSLRIYT